MVSWLYQMSERYWDNKRDPIEQYKKAVSRGYEIRWPRFHKSRARRTEPPLPPMRRGDHLIVVFLPSTRLLDGNLIETPGIYGIGKLTADEDQEKGTEGDVCWRPLGATTTLVRRPIPWDRCKALLKQVRGTGRATVYPILPATWRRLERLIDESV